MLSTVILAAGKGKRMHSELPKVLHLLGGKPLLEHVVTTARLVNNNAAPFIVYGHAGEQVKRELAHMNAEWVHQNEQLGTGHALLQVLPFIPENHRVVVLYGDVPLISTQLLNSLIHQTPGDSLGLLTLDTPNPAGLGRILRDENNKIIGIIEEKEANDLQRTITEVNSGIFICPVKLLKEWLPTLSNQNAQNEFYLTDIISLASRAGIAIHGYQPTNNKELLGVNDRTQLASLERHYQQQQAERIMHEGATILDPARFDVRGEAHIGTDTQFDINVILEGHVTIGKHCVIGPNCVLRNVFIGDRVEIKANSVLDGVEIANDCIVGPFARLRPGTTLAERSHVGNFVEVKNSEIGSGTKINHLSYIGDAEIGRHVNIGAGTITCNYDGINKHRTQIGDEAFIGSNSALVAPITIGENATIGAGSTLSRNVPPNQLTLTRTPQRSIENWQRPQKKES